jgi:hypothetical protein
MGDSSLFWLWFVLIVVFLIIWVVVKNDFECESGNQKKSINFSECNLNFESAAEGALLLLAIPLIIYILFFILVGLVALSQRACTGCWMWDHNYQSVSV